MKKYLILFLVFLKISPIFAQQLSEKTQIVFDACFKLRTAIASGNTTGLRSANKILKECDWKDLNLHPRFKDYGALIICYNRFPNF